MKKYFVFAAATLVALAACTKVETDETPAKKISFNPTTYVAQTKANVSLNDVEGVTTFKSKAFMHANGAASNPLNFFGTTGVSVNYASNTWAPADDYFWPKATASYINFVSWYASRGAIEPAAASITETSMKWGTAAAPISIESTDNILFAEEAFGYHEAIATSDMLSDNAKGVPTLFHHALSKIMFQVKLKTDVQSTRVFDVDVISASLKVADQGYLELKNTIPAALNSDISSAPTGSTANWQIDGGTEDGTAATSSCIGWKLPTTYHQENISVTGNVASPVVSISNFEPSATNFGEASTYASSATELIAERTVMPQSLGTASSTNVPTFTMQFQLSIYGKTNGTKDANPFSQEVITVSEANLISFVNTLSSWNMNKKITYTVTIDPVGKKITFDPAVVDWEVDTTPEGEVYSAN